jgi:protein-disulfide isomerase
MRTLTLSFTIAACAVLLLSACHNDAGARADEGKARPGAPAAEEKASDVVAQIDGAPITRAELDQKAHAALQRVREQEYEARKEALDGLVTERLFEREAKARGISKEQLLKEEVEAKVPEPTAKQIQDLYDQNRGRVGSRTVAELTPEITDVLRDRARSARSRAYEQELRAKAKVTITLQQPRTEVPIPADAQILGPKDAKVTLVEYSDYLCPYCQHAQEVVDKVVAQNPKTLRFVHRDFLLGRPRSLAVARAALCAGEQGKFWEFRGSLLTHPGVWSDTYLSQRAVSLGLKPEGFNSCLASTKYDAQIQASSTDGSNLGVTGTPTFFINGRRMTGVRSVEQLQEAIDAEVKAGS